MPYVSSYSTDNSAQMVISDKFGYNKNLFVMTDYPNYPTGYEGGLLIESEPKASYIALGDSFSSGEGNPAFEPGTNINGVNECHRSPQAYPRLLQAELNLGSTAFAACSGATTASVLYGGTGSGNWGEGPQIDALSEETEVVTITIGGNDVGFGDFAKKCVSPLDQLIFDQVCDEYTDVYDDITSGIATMLPNKLEEVYAEILEHAPNAIVYVGGYPLISPYKAITDPFDQDCGGLYDEFPNNWGDARAAYAVANLLNSAIEDAVDEVNNQAASARLRYVDVSSGAFYSHDICETDSFFNGIDILNPSYSIHPNEDGQNAYAEDFEGVIDQ